MATQKAINANPIKNNSGATLGEGNFSKLNTTGLGNTPTSGPSLGKFQSVSLQIQTTPLISGIHIGGKVEDFYRTQLTQYSSKLYDVNPLTNQGSRTNSTDVFVVNDAQQGNNNTAYNFGGRPQKFNYVSKPSDIASSNMTSSAVQGLYAQQNARLLSGKLGMSIFSGAVNASGNVWHDKTFTVTKTQGGTVSSQTYTVPAWSKLNLNFASNVTSAMVSTSDDIQEGFKLGFRPSFAQASTRQRQVQLSVTNTNPITFNHPVNLTLSGAEKAIKITASGAIVHQIMIQEVDNQGNKSPVVYELIPSGLSFTYYPAYNNLAISDVINTSFWVETLV